MDRLSDKIMLDWYYPVGMFPLWLSDKYKERLPKVIRLVMFLVGLLWFIMLVPLTFLVLIITIPIMIWEQV